MPDDVKREIQEAIEVLHVTHRSLDPRAIRCIETLLARVRLDHPGQVRVLINGDCETL